jgi:hypothetical protein
MFHSPFSSTLIMGCLIFYKKKGCMLDPKTILISNIEIIKNMEDGFFP